MIADVRPWISHAYLGEEEEEEQQEKEIARRVWISFPSSGLFDGVLQVRLLLLLPSTDFQPMISSPWPMTPRPTSPKVRLLLLLPSTDFQPMISSPWPMTPRPTSPKDGDVVERCLTAVNALASYHFKERLGGRGGLSSQLMESEGSNGKVQESISSHFLRLLLQLLLFEDFRMELAGSAADALLPLLLCEQELYQRLVHELLEKQQNLTVKSRLAVAFHNLTSSNNLSSTFDRPNRQKFRKNLRAFLGEVSGFMQIK